MDDEFLSEETDCNNCGIDAFPAKPITVAQQEFISTLANLINTSSLPAFIIEPILKDMYNEVRDAAKRQYINDKNRYEQALTAAQERLSAE